jgi:predicted aspartyl protease
MNIQIDFEHTQGMATAHALIDSGTTENFVDYQTAKRWNMPRKGLSKPRQIMNVDGTENKAGQVTEACILEVRHGGNKCLQRFYITDLGFDRVLLGYPWLSTFNPRIDWKEGKIEGRTMLKTVRNAWERWKELRRQALVAHVEPETDVPG